MSKADHLVPKKILIIQLRQMGDVLLTTPVIRSLRNCLPDAHITFLTEESAYPIIEDNDDLSEVIVIKRKQTLMEQIRVILDIRKRSFDLIFDFFANPRTGYIAFFSKAQMTVSYDIPFRRFLYKKAIMAKGTYAADHKLSLLSVIGLQPGDNTPYMKILSEAEEKVASFLSQIGIKEEDFLVCMDTTSRRAFRCWNADRFAEVADRLKEQYNAKVIFLWGPGEKELVENLMATCRHRHFLDYGTNVKEMTALIKRSDLLIGNSSFPGHVAVSQQTPTITVLGSAGKEWTHPAPIHVSLNTDLPCQPCTSNPCDQNFKCLTDISVQNVMTSFEKLKPFIEKLN